MGAVQVLLLTGAPGVGKSAVAEEMFEHLAANSVRHAVIDVDALCLSFPFRPGDPFNTLTALENLRVVWQTYARQGIDRLVLVRLVESRDEIQALAEQVPGAEVMVCLLTAEPATVEDRVRRREVGSSVERLVERGRELAFGRDGQATADLVVDTEDAPLPQLAVGILSQVGWLAADGGS